MTSLALDVVTMIHAFNVLEERYLGTGTEWQPRNPEHARFLDWRKNFGSAVRVLPGLNAAASTDYTDLNAVLEEHGYEPKFQPFNGVGVVSLLDILVEWLIEGKLVDGRRWDESKRDFVEYPAFSLPSTAAEAYRVPGLREPLLRLSTKSGYDLWLIAADRPATGLDMFEAAADLLNAPRELIHGLYVGAQVPMLDLRVDPDLSWLLGIDTESELDGYHAVEQAFQTVHIRANQKGARGKAMTGVGTTRGGPRKPQPYVLNQPFIGFFTYKGIVHLPQCAFFADPSDWKAPADLD